MTPGKYDPLRIVQSWPGASTGETIYQTNDGRVWKEGVPSADQTAPPSTGKIEGNYIWVDS